MTELSKTKYVSLKKSWEHEDRLIRGEIARYLAMKGISMATLGGALGISKSTMYAKYKSPAKFTLEEKRILTHLFKELS